MAQEPRFDKNDLPKKPNALALVDGEHYPPVIMDALEQIKGDFELVGAVFLGGTEKVKEGMTEESIGARLFMGEDMMASLELALDAVDADVIIDLSDEPIVGYKERFRLASKALQHGISYVGSDFQLNPPLMSKSCSKPSCSVIGTGKRTGKTAVCAHFARLLKEKGKFPTVVAMGRGGPKEPEVIRGDQIELTPEYLLDMSRKGFHAASDHFEDALMSRIQTVGCRRCGGGLAGQPFVSNVAQGAAMASMLEGDIVLFEGSGSAVPPVETNCRVLIAGAGQPVDYITGMLGTYRVLISDMAVITNCEGPLTEMDKVEEITAGIKEIKDMPVFKTVFRPKPFGPIEGRKVAFFTTAPKVIVGKLAHHLEENYACTVIGTSCHLSNRPLLRSDIKEFGQEADIFLSELKAAAVDVVAEAAAAMGKKMVFCDNIPITVDGQDMDEAFLSLIGRILPGL